ncbi:11311_t:CDS:1, partial [Gigaspora rosea]
FIVDLPNKETVIRCDNIGLSETLGSRLVNFVRQPLPKMPKMDDKEYKYLKRCKFRSTALV